MMPEIFNHGNANIFHCGIHAEGHAGHGAVQNTGGNNFVLFVHHLVVELFVVFRHPVIETLFGECEQFTNGFDGIGPVTAGFTGQ